VERAATLPFPTVGWSVQRSEPRLEALATDLVGLDDHLHALRGCEVARCLEGVAAGWPEVDVDGLTLQQDLALGAAAVDSDGLLVGVEDVECELVALGDQLPVLLAAAGIDDVAALRAFGPLAVAVREGEPASTRLAMTASARNMMVLPWLRFDAFSR
jgi:hypothetical protein